jgi:hypothetical protein
LYSLINQVDAPLDSNPVDYLYLHS